MANSYFHQGLIKGNNRLISVLKNEIAEYHLDNLFICTAYATFRGVSNIRSILSNHEIRTRWILGLDDFITEAEAIRAAIDTDNSVVRVKRLLPERRFHSKIYLLTQSSGTHVSLIIGSNNLTEAGLNRNCEAFMVLRSSDQAQKTKVLEFWNDIWKTSKVISDDEINKYAVKRKSRPPIHREIVDESISKMENRVFAPKKIPNLIKYSKLVWIVLGKNTGGGSQLDIVKDIAPFLYLPVPTHEGLSRNLIIRSKLGKKTYKLTFSKGMWRFMGLQKGFTQKLRPDLSMPSPFLLTVEKLPKRKMYMRIFRIGGVEAEEIMQKSKEIGFIGSSLPGKKGRVYGWF